MFSLLCFHYYVFTTMFSLLCFHYYVFTTMFSLLCFHYYVFTTMVSLLCSLHLLQNRCKMINIAIKKTTETLGKMLMHNSVKINTIFGGTGWGTPQGSEKDRSVLHRLK